MKTLLVFILGVGVGYWIKAMRGGESKGPNAKQEVLKEERLGKVVEWVRERGEVSNDEVRAFLGVSDSSVTAYMDELERRRQVEQVGKTGQAVKYRLK